LKKNAPSFRIGIGYDIHPLVEGRPLVLGGVGVPYEKGLSGHSDADVLVHALCDALLGAIGRGDLGAHFPGTPEWKGAASVTILERVAAMTREAGYRLVNADCIIHAEEPRLAPYRERMCETLARIVGAEPGDISIKASSCEGLGPVGEKRAMAAEAVVLLEKEE